MASVTIEDTLAQLEALGVTVVQGYTGSPQLGVYIVATPDHYFDAQFEALSAGQDVLVNLVRPPTRN